MKFQYSKMFFLSPQTVNVEMFAQYIHLRISRRALNAHKLDVSKNCDCKRTNRNKQHMRENLTARICLKGLDAQKFSCAKISTFTVAHILTSTCHI